MNTMWRVLSGLCAAALIATIGFAPGVTAIHAQACTELLTDGGFETGIGWQLGPSPVMPQYVTYTRHSGNRSLSLGITSGANVESFSSARQTVAIPAGGGQVLLSFWFYAMADAPATTDYMEVVLLDATGAAILNKPWRSHNDSRIWNQMTFDLSAWRGQTVQLYFNVYNDGVGGRAAMFLDDVSLLSCAGVLTAAPTGTVTATGTSGPATLTPTLSPTPGCVDLLVDGRFDNGLANWQVVGDSAGAAPVSALVRSAPYALKLGSLDQNLNGLTTVRQLVTIPSGYSQVTLEAWIYTQTQAGAGADYQRIALLNSAGNLLYRPWEAQENNPAWQQLVFNVSAFAGETVFVSFSVNNDGVGGRTAMFVDDVRLRACMPGAGEIPTPTRTPSPTTSPVASASPTATVAPAPPGCIELTQNGGFEAGFHPWQAGASSLPAQLVDDPVFSGAYAMQLGSLTENSNTYSSIRQVVMVPANRPRVVVSFWAYTWAEALSGIDRQQFVLLSAAGEVWTVPWAVLSDERMWQQHVFDVVGAAGQSFFLYFNAINDGVGGRTALFVDEVRAWACTSDSYPSAVALDGEALSSPSDTMPFGSAPAITLPDSAPDVALLPDTSGLATAAAPAAGQTRVALEAPQSPAVTRAALEAPQSLAVTRVALESPEAAMEAFDDDAVTPASGIQRFDLLSDPLARLPGVAPILVVGIVALLLLLLVLARPRL